MTVSTMRVSPVPAPVREQLLSNLRGAIFNRTFAPGQRLVERELCELTGVSRTSIREALRQLEAEGLVKILPHRGPIVARISTQEAAELYEVRAVLEALGAQLFTTRATTEQIDQLAAIIDRIEAADPAEGPTNLLALKDEFYTILMAGADNAMLLSVLESLRARVTHLRGTSLHRPGRSRDTADELRVLVDAIRRGDADAAWSAARHHVQQAASVALQVLAEEEDEEPAAAD